MRRLVYSLSLLAGLCACTPQQDTHAVYHSFQTTDTLVTEVHAIPPIMLYPKGMYLVDSFLVVYNRDMDTCYQVFDRQTLEYQRPHILAEIAGSAEIQTQKSFVIREKTR